MIDPPHERACRQRTLHAVPTAVHKRTEATRPEGLRCTRENSRLSSVAPRPPDGWLYVLRTSAEVPPNRPSGPGATAVGRLPTGVRGSREPIQARTHRLPAPGTFPDILLNLRRNHFSCIRFPPNGFAVFLTLFSKYFSPFPHGTCSLSVSCQYLALDGVYHPLWAAFPNNPTLRRR